MQIFSTFEQSMYLELAIASLEKQGIKKENILAVPLDNRQEERRLFDSIHRSDGISLFDTGAALSTAFSVIGASVGFALEWGPIIWGLIGASSGFLTGFFINIIFYKVFRQKQKKIQGKASEVVLVVECKEEQSKMVESILWDHLALGVGKLT